MATTEEERDFKAIILKSEESNKRSSISLQNQFLLVRFSLKCVLLLIDFSNWGGISLS